MKLTLAVVQEKMHPLADRTDEQVQTPIPIYIRQHRARGVEVCQIELGLLGDVLEFPITKIAIKRAAATDAAKEQVAQTVTIDITCCHTRTVEENVIG